MEKLLTIVVPVYNTEKYLSKCLDSLIVRKYMEHLEILVVIDGSPDNSAKIAREYEKAGADCISVLTETDYFKGEDRFLREINDAVQIPTIRKDFIIDEYMIYEAKLLGASCVLLIAALLDTETIRQYKAICDQLGLSALVEAHDEAEAASALAAGARMVGVNNRNLKDFTVDIHNSTRLRELVPRNVLFVAESGIKTAEDIAELVSAGVNGVLIGETLMRSPDKAQMLDELRSRV